LVIAATVIPINCGTGTLVSAILIGSQFLVFNLEIIAINKNLSPNRLISIVNTPAPNERELL